MSRTVLDISLKLLSHLIPTSSPVSKVDLTLYRGGNCGSADIDKIKASHQGYGSALGGHGKVQVST